MKNLFIYCDGGFGNRFNSLIVGLILSKLGNFNPVIMWPKTSACGSSFKKIFENDYDVIEKTLDYFYPIVNSCAFAMHGNFLNFNTEIFNCNNIKSIDNILQYYKFTNKEFFVYNNDRIPDCITLDLIKEVYISLGIKINTKLLDVANNFIEKNNLNNFYGIHLRDTDFHQIDDMSRYDKYYDMVSNDKSKKYFVCSDNKLLEQKFNELPNVFIRNKTQYVEKLNDNSQWANNVNRPEDSVLEAIVDLLILSKSDIIKTSESSFLKTAKLFNFINNG